MLYFLTPTPDDIFKKIISSWILDETTLKER